MGSQSGDVEDGGVIFSFGHWKIRRLSELEVIRCRTGQRKFVAYGDDV